MSSIQCLLAIFYWILLSRHVSGQAAGRHGAVQVRKLGAGYTSPWMEEILDEKEKVSINDSAALTLVFVSLNCECLLLQMEHYWSESLEMSMSMSMSFPLPAHRKLRA